MSNAVIFIVAAELRYGEIPGTGQLHRILINKNLEELRREPLLVVLAARRDLLLDEVADMPLETQGKIVRALQDQTFERVGGTRPIRTDVRFVAATNRDLDREMVERALRMHHFNVSLAAAELGLSRGALYRRMEKHGL